MGSGPGGRGSRRQSGLVLVALMGVLPAGAQDPAPRDPAPQPTGGIRGHVTVPDIGLPFDSVSAILLPPEWSLLWRGEVQQRLDLYSQNYRALIASDPGLFDEISRGAHREATVYVLMRMESSLGAGFGAWESDVSAEGAFEYSRIAEGDYTVVVVARQGGRGMIWAESVSVGGQLPVVLEVENRIQ